MRNGPAPGLRHPQAKRVIADHPVASLYRLFTRIVRQQEPAPLLLPPLGFGSQVVILRALCDQWIRHACGVDPRAGPTVVPRCGHHSGHKRVALDVPAATEKVIPALNRRALEASLPAVANETMATMAVVHIGPKEPCHHRRDFARVAQFDQQVKVVGHQAIMEGTN
jgi:hypothetical protein